MSPTTLLSTEKRSKLLKGLLAFVLCSSFVLPQIFAPRTAKAASTPVPNSAPPEAFLLPSSSMFTTDLIGSLVTAGNSIREAINGPVLPEGFEMAKPPSLAMRLGSTMASMIGVKAAEPQPAPPPPAGSVSFDFDGDGKADIAKWRSANSEFKIQNSNGGLFSTYTLGSAGSKSAPGDYDGDGKTDAAVFNAGTWTIRKSSTGTTQTVNFGISGDIPVTGDYDGDGISDVAIYRPSTGTWWVLNSSNGASPATAFGVATDIPVPGNYDGDSKTDLAVFRPSTGDWHILGSTSGYYQFHWGVASDIPVPADFDGDGKTDCSVYRGSSGAWYVYKSSSTTGEYIAQAWGNYGDQPVPADYDGDGKADFSVWRPTNGVWYTIKSSNGAYDYKTLGIAGDTAVPSSYLKQIGGQVFGYSLAKARLSPKNSTGGTDLYSRNFSWGSSLVGLPGRAGLDAGFGISYNSLVWTKDGNAIYFDTNQDNVSPGFRLGFSTIEPVYYDTVTQKWNYLMVTPSGGRIEFRQTAASDTYETADSSYVQLKTKGAPSPNSPVENISITVTGTDGTQMNYEWKGGAFRCSEIKDRNGNFISINHDDQGVLRTVTDTLGRMITVNYDSQLYPTSITQTWKTGNGDGSDTPHTWANFAYTTKEINTSFTGITDIFGPSNGTILKVLERVTFADSSSTRFTYNSYGQVWKVQNYAADGINELNRVSTDLESPSSSQPDCPKFSQTISYVQNFNGGTPITVNNTLETSQTYSVGGISGSGTRIQVWMSGHPDNLRTNTFVGESGWLEGLPLATEDCITTTSTCSDRKRWTWQSWTQDDPNPNLTYILNPRVTESKVGDTTNTKRSTVEYRLYPNTTIAEYGLVSAVNVYDTNQATVLKRSETDYNLSSAYLTRRIIGLPSETRGYGYENGSLPLVSKMTYLYDEGSFNDSGLSQDISPVQHDNSNYGASFVIGRGNVTSTTRHDVLGQSAATTSSIKYNTAGAPVSQTDPMNRVVKIGYADNFNSAVSGSTYAYPTVLTDPANNSSTVQYRYDIGANIEAISPAPAGNSFGKKTKRFYDAMGRLERDSVYLDTTEYSYVRHEYPSNGVQSKVYSTIVDTNNSGMGDTADEVLSESFADGAGRVRMSRKPHTFDDNGNTLTWAGSVVEYDILGRVKRQMVPTEVNSSFVKTGDDANRDYLWTVMEYDWKGRMTRTVNTDGTDTLAEYDGCGCAGSTIVTLKGELLTEGRRTQKIYSDILGREIKHELFDWNNDVYETTVNKYNGRDQIVLSSIYAGTESATDHRDTTFTFDGHGRISSKHESQQDVNAAAQYTYFPDDFPQTITDARGAAKHYAYNNRGLLEEISWTVPQNSGIEIPPTVEFEYDNLGNRTFMSDGIGSVDYDYDSLSRMSSEVRSFNETVPLAPQANNAFPITYTYNLSSQLATLTEPFGEVISYSYDKVGRLKSVSGNRVSESAQLDYITDTNYRAWGSVKELQSNAFSAINRVEFTYNNRLLVDDYKFKQNSTVLEHQAYQYFDDGRLKFSSPSANSNFDRSYEYDFLGRLTAGRTGAEARGYTESNPNNRPFRIELAYNRFGNITEQQRLHWTASFGSTFSYTNGRNSSVLDSRNIAGWSVGSSTTNHTFDPDGRMTDQSEFDADGGMVRSTLTGNESDPTGYNDFHIDWLETTIRYSGIGEKIKIVKNGTRFPHNESSGIEEDIQRSRYYVHSSVIGEDIVEVERDHYTSLSGSRDDDPNRRLSIFANGEEIATRAIINTFSTDRTVFRSVDPSGVVNATVTLRNGNGSGGTQATYGNTVTTDPYGAVIGSYNDVYPAPPPGGYPDPNDPNCQWNDYDDYSCEVPEQAPDLDSEEAEAGSVMDDTCYLDGFENDCDLVRSMEKSEAADIGPWPWQQWRRLRNPRSGEVAWGEYKNYGEGQAGWWADTNGRNPGDVDSVHIPFDSNRNALDRPIPTPKPEPRRQIRVRGQVLDSALSAVERVVNAFKSDPCAIGGNPTLNLFRSVSRSVERDFLKQDVLADALKGEVNIAGFTPALTNTRDGQLLFSFGGAFDPKNLYVDQPKNMPQGGRMPFGASLMGQKIWESGNLDEETRTNTFREFAMSAGGGNMIGGDVTVSSPFTSGRQTVIVSGGFTTPAITAGSLSYSWKLPVKPCLRW